MRDWEAECGGSDTPGLARNEARYEFAVGARVTDEQRAMAAVRKAIDGHKFHAPVRAWEEALERRIVLALGSAGFDAVRSVVSVRYNSEDQTRPAIEVTGALASVVDTAAIYDKARAHDTADYTPGGDDGR